MTSLDLRLLPLLLALWLGSAVGLHTRASIPAYVLGAVLATALVMLRRMRAVLPWGVALLLGLVLAGLRADAASPRAVEQAVDAAGVVAFSAVIESEPMLVDRPGFGGLSVEQAMVARVLLRWLDTGTQRWHVSIPATMQWANTAIRPAIGRQVSGRALIRPDDVVSRSAYWVSVRGALRLDTRETRGARLSNIVRTGLASAIDAQSAGDGAALLPGLVLGDTRAQSAQLVDDLRVSGLSHLTSVSGANLAIVIGAVAWLFTRTRIRAAHRHVLLLATIAGFVAVVRPQPSVVRAAMMGAITVFALATGARRASASILWLSVVLLLIVDPFLAWQWGFALSVAATAGLIVLSPRFSRLIPGRLGPVLGITLAAQAATFPVLLAMGRPPTLLSVPANVLCEPLVAPATVLGFVAALIAALAALPGLATPATFLAALIAWPGVVLAGVIAAVAHRGAASPLAITPIADWWQLISVIGAVLILLRMGLRRRALTLFTCIMLGSAMCFPDGVHRWPSADWWFAMCDVGQGDSSVLNLGGGTALVFDLGPEVQAERRCLRRLGVHRIAGLFVTHYHADHVEGLGGALSHTRVDRVFATSVREPALEWARIRAQLPFEPTPLQRGDRVRFGATRVDVLWPDPAAVSGEPNNASLVLDISRGGWHILVTGDADAAAQAAIVLPVHAYAVLKVPHHGSRYRDPGFLARVRPTLALISVGVGNHFGHPAVDTVAELRRLRARVLRTDLVGSIAVSVRSGGLSYSTLSG